MDWVPETQPSALVPRFTQSSLPARRALGPCHFREAGGCWGPISPFPTTWKHSSIGMAYPEETIFLPTRNALK